MNEKGRQTKLLAAIAVLAMVVCVFAVVMPSDNVEGVNAPVVPSSFDGEIDELADFTNATSGDYYIDSNINVGPTNSITINTNATIWILDGGSITIASNAGDVTINGTVNVMNGGSVTYLKAVNLTGTVNVCYGAELVGYDDDSSQNQIGANGFFKIDDAQSYIALGANSTGKAFTVYGNVTADDAEIWSSDKLKVTAGSVVSGTFAGSSGTFESAANIMGASNTATYYGSVPSEIELKDGESFKIMTSNASDVTVIYGNNTVELNDVASQSGNEITLAATGNTLSLSGTATGGSLTMIDGAVAYTSSGLTVAKAIQSNGYYYTDFSDVPTTNTSVRLYGDYSNNGNVSITTTSYQMYVESGSKYNGTVSIVESNSVVASVSLSVDKSSETYSGQSATAVLSYSNNTITVTGNAVYSGTEDATKYATGSNVIVTGVTSATVSGSSPKNITLNDVALSTMTLRVPITVGGDSVLPEGNTLTFGDTNAKITIGESGKFYVLGSLMGTAADMFTYTSGVDESGNITSTQLYALNPTAVGYYVNRIASVQNPIDYVGSLSSNILNYNGTADSAQAIMNALRNAASNTEYTIVLSGTTTPLYLWGELELRNITINLGAGLEIQIGVPANITGFTEASATVIMNNVTVESAVSGTPNVINVNNGSAFRTTSSFLFVVVTSGPTSSVNLDNGTATYDNTTSNVRVGAGMTLILNGAVRNVVDVFGNLVINDAATIDQTNKMNVYQGASVTINGEMTILGIADFQTGSEGTVNGTVTIGNNTGGALLNVDGDFTITSEGKVSVSSVRSDNANKNRLNAPDSEYDADSSAVTGYSYGYKFIVEGTLDVDGMLAGYIHNMGTVTINGFEDTNVSYGATVVIYDGIEMTIDSFAGPITVTDEGIADSLVTSSTVSAVSDANAVTLTNVSAITVTTEVSSAPYTGHVDYYTTMYLSGNPGAIRGTSADVEIEAADGPVGLYDEYRAQTVIDTETEMVFGSNVGLTVSGILDVQGQIEFLDLSVGTSNPDNKSFSGNGTISVSGQIAVSEEMDNFAGRMNAAMYVVSITGAEPSITNYYTNFAAAVAVENADNDTITVMGEINVEGEVTIPAGITVEFTDSAVLNVVSGAELILANGAYMEAPNTVSIDVDGIFTAENAEDMGVGNIVAEVIIANAPAKTWTSLAGAISMGETEITANGEINIDEDLTIPEGTTVDTEYDVNVNDDAVLTVDGELNIDGADLIVDTDADVVVNGTVSVTGLSQTEPTGIASIDGVHYALTDGAYITHYVSNLADAAERVSSATNVLNNSVRIIGSVSAENVTITASVNGLNITFEGTTAHPAILAMGTMALNGAVTFGVGAYPTEMFTGTISAPCGDGTANASIQMARASGFTVETYSEVGVTTTYILEMWTDDEITEDEPAFFTGDVNVAAGTVTVVDVLAVGDGAGFTVDAGATLAVRNNASVVSTYDYAEFAGTVNVADDIGLYGVFDITGTLNATNSSGFSPYAILYVTGTLTMDDRTTMNVVLPIIVGDAPETLGIGGTLTGSYRIVSNYILTYAGSDLSGAQINWNSALNQSDAQATTYYVNDIEYATVYANGGVDIDDIFGYVPEDATNPNGLISIEIVGYDNAIYNNNGTIVTVATPYTWYTADGQRANGTIGSADTVYVTFDLAAVGGTISKDAGIILTIDDLVIGSNGDVSQTVRDYGLTVGTHTIAWSERTGYNIENVTVTFNGQAVENGGTITITADMQSYTIVAQGAVPGAAPGGDSGSSTASDDGLGLTDYLLIVLVILIVVMAIMVAVRLMRS